MALGNIYQALRQCLLLCTIDFPKKAEGQVKVAGRRPSHTAIKLLALQVLRQAMLGCEQALLHWCGHCNGNESAH